MATSGIDKPFVDLGHVGIYRELVKQADLNKEQEATLFDSLQRKANTEIATLLNEWKLDSKIAKEMATITFFTSVRESKTLTYKNISCMQ